MGCCSGFWMFALPLAFLWWLFASAILFAAWNHAIVAATSAKPLSYKHALLLVFTMGVLCAPHHMQNYGRGSCKMTQVNIEEEVKP